MQLPAAFLLAIITAAAQRRSAPRDQAAAQRREAPAAGESRSTAARRAFQRSNPCPATHKTTGPCPGYVIDHVIALKRGGPDAPSNMQWQTVAEAKAKDRIE
jgi:hypothetical protein